MSYITGDFPVIADGRNVGRVHIEQNGSMLVFDCTCNYKSHDILRLAAVCDGTYVPLGVTAPDAGLLHLKKSYTKNALASIGYDDSRYQEGVPFYLVRSGDVYSANDSIVSAPQIDGTSEALTEPAIPDIAYEEILSTYTPEPIVYNDFPEPTEYYFETEAEENTNYSEPVYKTLEPVPALQPGFNETANTLQAPEPKQELPVQEPFIQLSNLEPITTKAEQNSGYSDGTPAALNGWIPIPNPGILFDDFGVQEACVDIPNAHIKEQDDFLLLGVPVSQTEPFPMMPVFCFGSSEKIGEQDCIIFKIRNGNLTL